MDYLQARGLLLTRRSHRLRRARGGPWQLEIALRLSKFFGHEFRNVGINPVVYSYDIVVGVKPGPLADLYYSLNTLRTDTSMFYGRNLGLGDTINMRKDSAGIMTWTYYKPHDIIYVNGSRIPAFK